MKYIVPVSGAEHLFHANEDGLWRAKEFALASRAKVFLERNGKREVIFPEKKVLTTRASSGRLSA